MKIISIFRQNNGLALPVKFIVGDIPQIGDDPPVGPPVSCIKHFGLQYNGGKHFKRECYVVEFEDSPVKRIIPESSIIEVVIDTTKESDFPELPETAS